MLQMGRQTYKLLKIWILATGLLLGFTTLTAEASLTAGVADGKNVVYSSVSNITWLADANLLGTLERTLGYDTTVNAIINASPVINDTPNGWDTPANSGSHTLSAAADFNPAGLQGFVSWFGAKAFVNYLNSINYAGSNQWVLPTAGANPPTDFNKPGSQFGELFYDELGGTVPGPIPNTNFFSNEERNSLYWLNTELASIPNGAWAFHTCCGGSAVNTEKGSSFFVWAVAPGNLLAAPVPVPGAIWMFGTGLLGLLGLKRRGNA